MAVGRRRMGIVTLIRGSGLGIRSLFGDGDGGLDWGHWYGVWRGVGNVGSDGMGWGGMGWGYC